MCSALFVLFSLCIPCGRVRITMHFCVEFWALCFGMASSEFKLRVVRLALLYGNLLQVVGLQDSYTRGKRPTKEPHIPAKKPYIPAKEPCISAQEPSMSLSLRGANRCERLLAESDRRSECVCIVCALSSVHSLRQSAHHDALLYGILGTML